jgi:hypothetical protein
MEGSRSSVRLREDLFWSIQAAKNGLDGVTGSGLRPRRRCECIFLDPFLGSGSTLIAAQNTGRVCCGVELDTLYIDVIIRRYEASTGIAAIGAADWSNEGLL